MLLMKCFIFIIPNPAIPIVCRNYSRKDTLLPALSLLNERLNVLNINLTNVGSFSSVNTELNVLPLLQIKTLMDDITKEREELIEMFGVHFETVHHLSPLSARIFGTLILDAGNRKISFDDLVELTGASKSSVSTNLNLLLKLGKINYFTVPGDRKKYYRPSPFSERFDNYMKMIAFEKQIIDRMLHYRERTIGCAQDKLDIERTKTYKEHMTQMENLIVSTVNKFKALEEKE